MAPKRRRKCGLTRMDAALDQMSLYGFSRQLVRKTVNNLLKLYGNDGWKLIEEDGYRVLLDVILDEQETTQTQNMLKDAPSQHENTANELVSEESNEVATKNTTLEGNNNALLAAYTEVKTYKITPKDKQPILSIEGPKNQECWNDIALDKTDQNSLIHTGNDHSADELNLKYLEDLPLSDSAIDKACAPGDAPFRRRKPCYGWISEDDDDEETCFIELTPAD